MARRTSCAGQGVGKQDAAVALQLAYRVIDRLRNIYVAQTVDGNAHRLIEARCKSVATHIIAGRASEGNAVVVTGNRKHQQLTKCRAVRIVVYRNPANGMVEGVGDINSALIDGQPVRVVERGHIGRPVNEANGRLRGAAAQG